MHVVVFNGDKRNLVSGRGVVELNGRASDSLNLIVANNDIARSSLKPEAAPHSEATRHPSDCVGGRVANVKALKDEVLSSTELHS